MPNISAALRPPPWSKMGVVLAQCGQTNWLMFSTMPSTGMWTLSNICLARTTSASATSCGVVTSTAPAARTLCESVSATSPVPGRQVQDEVVELAPVHVAHQLHGARRAAWARAR